MTIRNEVIGSTDHHYTYSRDEDVAGHTFRVRIQRGVNLYDCSAVASVLSMGNTWTEVASATPAIWFNDTPAPGTASIHIPAVLRPIADKLIRQAAANLS